MQRYFSDIKKENILVLKSDDVYYIKVVMRLKKDDLIEVVNNNICYLCRLNLDFNADIVEVFEKESKKLFISLIVPLLKEDKMSYILQKSTELGVSEFIPYNAKRSVIKLDNKKLVSKVERWNKICKEASEQSKRLDIPIIRDCMNIKDLKFNDGILLLGSTKSDVVNIKKVLKKYDKYDKIYIIVGPEGGFTDEEEFLLNEQGFISVSLGKRILRVETAPLVLVTCINYEKME